MNLIFQIILALAGIFMLYVGLDQAESSYSIPGSILILAFTISIYFSKNQKNVFNFQSVTEAKYPELKQEEITPFTEWLNADYARKSYSKSQQVRMFRGE